MEETKERNYTLKNLKVEELMQDFRGFMKLCRAWVYEETKIANVVGLKKIVS